MQNSPEKPKPRLGCAGIIRQGEGILMGIRNKPGNRGLWVLPGGGIRFCESFEQTLRREIEAEAGIQITPGAFFRVYELINPPNEHRVIIYLHGTHLSGSPKASTDLSEVRYLLPIEIKALSEQKQISPLVERVLRDAGILAEDISAKDPHKATV